MNKKWSYEDDLVCVESFFRKISLEKSFGNCQSSILSLVKENVNNWNQRSKSSWLLKLDNINYYFRQKYNLPLKGLKNGSKQMRLIVDDFIEKSEWSKIELKDFKNGWFENNNKQNNFKVPEKIIITQEILKRNKKLRDEYLQQHQICEYCDLKETFLTQRNGMMYFEVHHFIPFNIRTQSYYEKISLDVWENLISLCPNCHRKIHLANSKTQIEMIDKIWSFKNNENKFYSKIGIESIEKIIKMYEITMGIDSDKENLMLI